MILGIALYVSFALVCDSPEGLISNTAVSSALTFLMFISLAELYKEGVHKSAKGNRLEMCSVCWLKLI